MLALEGLTGCQEGKRRNKNMARGIYKYINMYVRIKLGGKTIYYGGAL